MNFFTGKPKLKFIFIILTSRYWYY